MKLRVFLIYFLLNALTMAAQDKLYFTNGTVRSGTFVSMNEEKVFFRVTADGPVDQFLKSDLIVVSKSDGTNLIFGKKQAAAAPNGGSSTFFRNNFSILPLELLVGRATITYERLSKTGDIGLVLPLSLTFDPMGFQNGTIDTSNIRPRVRGIAFITGADVNFYVGRKDAATFFIGPRFRYGTDMFLGEIEAITLQTQFGWRLGDSDSRLTQNLSFGYGFARIITAPQGSRLSNKKFYGWYSINYRFGISW
jgi:hypothetical protein